MVLGIQIVGILFALAMLYLTFHGFKRNQTSKQGLALWSGIWLIAIILSIFPQIISGLGGRLSVTGTIDFLTLIGFAFFLTLIFYLHQKVNKMENKLEKLVRTIAYKEVEKEKSKKHSKIE
ncbi:DUF2304 domain-containing protein [Candidatus Woesearchaeota archaeon]|nr:DUF2304 domain-containing protein [Candidatus Woesearchaeota archaeon]